MPASLTPTSAGGWAVVTGGSSGIGRAHAHELAARGFDVLIVGRDEDRLATVRGELQSRHGVTAETCRVDLAEPDGGEQLLAHIGDRAVGAFVAVAGSGSPGEFIATDLQAYLDCVTVKVRSNLVVLHRLVRDMAARGQGAVIIVSSTGALQGVPTLSNNAGTEAYLLAMSEALHHELAPRGVRVLGLMPGVTRTPGLLRMVPESKVPRGALTAEQTARESMRALEAGRSTHVAGAANRVLLGILPRRARVRLLSRMVGDIMTAGEERLAA